MGPSWAGLGGSWPAFGVSLGRLFSLLGALGGVLGALRLQRPFQEHFSLNLCCFLGGSNLERYKFYIRKTNDFQKIAVLLLGCLWDPSRGYFEKVLGSKIEVLGGLGPVWGGLGRSLGGALWGVVWSWVVLGGLG